MPPENTPNFTPPVQAPAPQAYQAPQGAYVPPGVANKSFLIRLAYMTGIPKTDRDAEKLLLYAAGAFIVIAIALPFVVGGVGSGKKVQQVPAAPLPGEAQ